MLHDQAKGPMTGSVLGLQRLIVDSPAFQRRCGVENASEAEQHVHLFDYEADPVTLQAARPFAAIWPADELDYSVIAGGVRNLFSSSGGLVLVLTDRDRYPRERNRSGLDFCGWIDEIVWRDMLGHAGEDDRLAVGAVRLQQGFRHSPVEDEASAGSYWHVSFLVDWSG